MLRENIADLLLFMVIAREKSFTRAAAQLGLSQSALSHAMRNLEERLDMRLLTRTTRSVAPTDAGKKLVLLLEPHIQAMQTNIEEIISMRQKPTGLLRITADEMAAQNVLWPKLKPFLRDYPDIQMEVISDNSLTDIVANQYDAGIRLGEQIAQDMISMRIGPDFSMAVVATPDYFAQNGTPHTPQDLLNHRCINMRLLTHGGIYAWEFEENGQEIRIRVDGQLIFNSIHQIMDACLQSFGIAYVADFDADSLIAEGKLIRVLEQYCPPFPGYYLYYPSRRQHRAAFSLLLERLRYRG